MKKITATIITTIVLLILFSCGKMYRGQYVGDWDFTVKRHIWILDSLSKTDTIYYLGKINRGKTDHELCIECMEKFSIFASVNESGELYNDKMEYHEYVEGHFEGKDKLYLTYGDGGMGGGATLYIEGIKNQK